MKKKYAKEQLQEAITKISNVMNNNKVVCFQKPIVPGDCPTFDEETANYERSLRAILKLFHSEN